MKLATDQEAIEAYKEENAQLKIENSYHADHTIYQGNCITCAEWEDTDRENIVLKKENQHISLTKLNDNKKLHNKIKSISSKYDTTITRQEKYIDRLQEENFKLKADLAQLQEDFEGEVKENDSRLIELNKCRVELEIYKDKEKVCYELHIKPQGKLEVALRNIADGSKCSACSCSCHAYANQTLSDISGKGEK